MRPFVYKALPARVVFGHGTISQVADEVGRLGCRRALVLSTPQQRSDAERLASHLGDFAAGVFAGAVMHTPVEVTEQATDLLRDLGSDCTIAIGGGSTIGLGKAIALRTDLPQITIPTTYAGSEATPIIGETERGRKTTQRSLKVLPEVIVYDVDLTLTLPHGLTTTSGMNAIAHAVEALYAEDANPVISLLAEQAIAILAQALRRITQNPKDREARADALYGAWACGTCLGSVGMALHHKLCHVLGGSFGLPHAETHTVVLPHAVAFNAPAAPEAMARVARALGVTDAAQGLFELAGDLGAPRSLSEIGMPAGGLDDAADFVVASPYWNPRPIERRVIRTVLQDAYDGRSPHRGS
jgi:maleylacetate reductase